MFKMNHLKKSFFMILLVICNTCYALYLVDNYDYHQRQGQDQQTKVTYLNIILPKTTIDDLEYIPTVQGYKFSYQLSDGSKREEIAYITGHRMDKLSNLDSKVADFTAIGIGGRPKIKLKNRKLSLSSLKSLSG